MDRCEFRSLLPGDCYIDESGFRWAQIPFGQSCLLRLSSSAIPADDAAPWPIERADGEAITVDGPWTVDFIEGGPELPAGYETSGLASWTDSGEAAQRFAGTARYSTKFELKSDLKSAVLSLSDVRESIRVFVDGTLVRTVVAHPFVCRLDELAAGKHRLDLDVTNLSSNRIRDLDIRGVEWKKFYDINYVNIDYRPFDASNGPYVQVDFLVL